MSNKRDQEREVTRRALIKWSLAAGAALGVSRTRILDVLGLPTSLIETVPDRPGHDRRYLLDSSLIRTELGWAPTVSSPRLTNRRSCAASCAI